MICISPSYAILFTARTWLCMCDVLEAIVTRLPPPKGDPDAPLKALLVDSWYDTYLGDVVLVHIVDGRMQMGERVRLLGPGAAYDA